MGDNTEMQLQVVLNQWIVPFAAFPVNVLDRSLSVSSAKIFQRINRDIRTAVEVGGLRVPAGPLR